MKLYVAELSVLEDYENEVVCLSLYGQNQEKLYELFCKETEKLFKGISSWDWKGDHKSQSVTRGNCTYFATITSIQTVC